MSDNIKQVTNDLLTFKNEDIKDILNTCINDLKISKINMLGIARAISMMDKSVIKQKRYNFYNFILWRKSKWAKLQRAIILMDAVNKGMMNE